MIIEPFDMDNESVFCARCGRKCEMLGHLMSQFMLCPVHGEFTIAPVVMRHPNGGWNIHFKDDQEKAMWDTCRQVDKENLSGRATRTG